MKIYMLLLILQTFIFANIQDRVKETCPQAYNMYYETVSNYLIRMEDDISTYGCKVIPIYSAIIETDNIEILDKIEASPQTMKHLIKLFYSSEQISNTFFQNSAMKNIILNNALHEDFIENFCYIIKKKLHRKQIQEIHKNPDYLNYGLLASLYAKNKEESIKLYNKLVRSISIELMPSFVFIMSAIGNNYSTEDLLENFATLERTLSSSAVKVLAEYPQYFVYFLYPSKEDLNISTISHYKLRKIQKNMQKKVLYLYQDMHDKYRHEKGINQFNYALQSIQYIYPYLLEQYDISYDNFRNLFHSLVEKGYILSLFSDGICLETSKENFATFGQNNINNAIELLNKESVFGSMLFKELKETEDSVKLFFYVANLYAHLNSEKWYIAKELLKELPYDYNSKIVFLQRLEQNGYFENIICKSNYGEMIYAIDGNYYPRYRYILLTPYPSQNDSTIFDAVLMTKFSDKALKNGLIDLMGMSREELETHEFTTSEKFFTIVDNVDNALIVVSILAIPFTFGSSLAGTASIMAKKITSKSFNHLYKKVLLKSKNIAKFTMKKSGKLKIAGLGSKLNIAKSSSKRIMQQSLNVVDKLDYATMGLLIGSGIYLYFDHSTLKVKTICEEQ